MAEALDDPYGTDLLMSNQGDLVVTAAGDLALVDGPLNCGQALINRLRTYPGELELQPGYGSAIEELVIGTKTGDPALTISRVNVELRSLLEQDPRFLAASGIQATEDPQHPERVAVRVKLELAAGDTITIDDLTAATLDTIDANAGEIATLEDAADGLADFDGATDEALDEVPGLDEQLEGLLPDGSLPTDESDS